MATHATYLLRALEKRQNFSTIFSWVWWVWNRGFYLDFSQVWLKRLMLPWPLPSSHFFYSFDNICIRGESMKI